MTERQYKISQNEDRQYTVWGRHKYNFPTIFGWTPSTKWSDWNIIGTVNSLEVCETCIAQWMKQEYDKPNDIDVKVYPPFVSK